MKLSETLAAQNFSYDIDICASQWDDNDADFIFEIDKHFSEILLWMCSMCDTQNSIFLNLCKVIAFNFSN